MTLLLVGKYDNTVASFEKQTVRNGIPGLLAVYDSKAVLCVCLCGNVCCGYPKPLTTQDITILV
jgi:hypothetical protein